VLDVDLADASDAKIWEYASKSDFVLISKDEDFLYLANCSFSESQAHLDSIGELPR